MEVIFKIGKLPDKSTDRLIYLYLLQEKLRLYHNSYGKDYRDGRITLEKFRKFQNLWFEPKNFLVCRLLNKCKENLKDDSTIDCSISDIEEK